MNIRILTFHCAKNYGAVLQAYALFFTLKEYTNDISIINYRPKAIMKNYFPTLAIDGSISFFYSLLRYILYFIRKFCCGYGNRLKKFSKFETDYLNINPEIAYAEKNLITDDDADFIFIGSDQVWNPRITNYDDIYFGAFKKNINCRLVSYAASIGNDMSSEKELNFLAQHVTALHKISVREETAKSVLSKFRNDIEVVLDPVFLLSNSEWEKIAAYSNDTDYLLLYNMGNVMLVDEVAEKLASSFNMPIVQIFAGGRSLRKIYRHKIYPGAGPQDFLGLFAHARYVVTSSFHGTAFSLIFNKQFLTVAHPTAGSRMRDLLARIGLSSRIVSSVNDIPDEEIDYSVVNERLDAERRKSFDFIERALGLRD